MILLIHPCSAGDMLHVPAFRRFRLIRGPWQESQQDGGPAVKIFAAGHLDFINAEYVVDDLLFPLKPFSAIAFPFRRRGLAALALQLFDALLQLLILLLE